MLDDDDLWLPSKLEEQMSAMKNDPDIGMVCCNGYHITDDNFDDTKLYRTEKLEGKPVDFDVELAGDCIRC